MAERVKTLIIGAGQAGLALSYWLVQKGQEHAVLEKASRPATAWRENRWDSFTLVTPNWTVRLPGAEYQGPEPDGFMGRQALVQYFDEYVERFHLPVRCNEAAQLVEPANGGYRIETQNGSWQAQNVVIATGMFQRPKLPAFSQKIPTQVQQIPSNAYRNPTSLPPGAVLVVGSAQTGAQIAEELYQAGRKVYLCVGSAGRVPRRYRGRDIVEWLNLTGFLSRTVAQLTSPQTRFAGNPHVSGKGGGRTLNLHQFYRDGVVLLGKAQDFQDGKLLLAPNLKENLEKVDRFEATVLKSVDDYIRKNAIQTPEESPVILQDGYAAPEYQTLDLLSAGITSIVWALGFSYDFSWIKQPVLDEAGYPVTQQGVTRFPGLYFLGMMWMDRQKSGLLLGVGEYSAHIAESIEST